MSENAFDLKETLLSASLSNNFKYDGLENTSELVDTVKDLFCGCTSELIVASVKGKTDQFQAKILADITHNNSRASFIFIAAVYAQYRRNS